MEILQCKPNCEQVFKPAPKPSYNINDFLPKKGGEIIIDAEIVDEREFISDGLDYYCCYCETRISDERVPALRFLGLHDSEFACLKCAEKTVQKVKGIYLQESGVSPLVITKKIGADTHFADSESITDLSGEDFFGS